MFKTWVGAMQRSVGDATNEHLEIIANATDDRIVSRWVTRGIDNGMFGRPGTGQPIEFSGIAIWRVEAGRLAECWVERSAYELYERLHGPGIAHLPSRTTWICQADSQPKTSREPGAVQSFAGRVFRYGFATLRVDRNPADILRGALTVPRVKHHAAIVDPVKVGELLQAIEDYSGRPETLFALRLAHHVFLRPGELRQALWSEIDFADKVWRIPIANLQTANLVRIGSCQDRCAGSPTTVFSTHKRSSTVPWRLPSSVIHSC